jgi:hypothetical protein
MSKSDDEPMLAFHAGCSSTNKADLVLDNCIVDMGTDEGEAKETQFAEHRCEAPTVIRHPGFSFTTGGTSLPTIFSMSDHVVAEGSWSIFLFACRSF